MPLKMDKSVWYVDVKDFGARDDGTSDDSDAINNAIAALPVDSFDGGTVIIPTGHYAIAKSINLQSGITIMGVSPQSTRLFTTTTNNTFLVANNASRTAIINLMLDGAGMSSIYGIAITGSIGCIIENVWIDSVLRGIHTSDSYYLHFDTVRMMGTATAYNFEAASNVITMQNCHPVTIAKAINWTTSATLNVNGCSFEGKDVVSLKNSYGASFNACYWEGLHEEPDVFTFVEVGGGDLMRGVSFIGNFFLKKAQYALTLNSCEGVSIEGNYFGTTVSGIAVYQADNAPKRDINICSNSYDIGNSGYDITKAIGYIGGDFNSLNCNFNSTQIQPMMFVKQPEPQDVTIEREAAVVYWDGTNLKAKIKDTMGVITIKTFTLS